MDGAHTKQWPISDNISSAAGDEPGQSRSTLMRVGGGHPAAAACGSFSCSLKLQVANNKLTEINVFPEAFSSLK